MIAGRFTFSISKDIAVFLGLLGSPAVTQGAVFVIGSGGSLYQLTQIGSGGWTPWINRGAPPGVVLRPSPAASLNNNDDPISMDPVIATPCAVAIGSDDRLYRLPALDSGYQWEATDSPSLLPSPAATTEAFDLFQFACAIGSDGVLQTFGLGGTESWVPLPGAALLPSPCVVVYQQAAFEVYAVGTDGALWCTGEIGSGGNTWTPWESLGSPPALRLEGSPAVNGDNDTIFHAFAIGSDGGLWHKRRLDGSTFGGPWSEWYTHGTPPGVRLHVSPVLGRSEDGRLELFSIGSDGALWHIWQTDSLEWSNWFSHGTPENVRFENAPALAQNIEGRLELFAVGNGQLWHIWQTAVNNGWSNWFSHGSPFD